VGASGAGCFDDSVPSTFGNGGDDAGGDANAGDAAHGGAGSDAGNLLGDGASAAFTCGVGECPKTTYCLLAYGDAGVETTQACYPLLQCAAGDCACVTTVAASAYCAGDHLACAVSGGVVVTCKP
jgi:hypothetical protein